MTASPRLVFALLLAGTVLGIAGTDLVLPAVPSLPGRLGGTPAGAQLVLAAFVAGTAIGLIGFGAAGGRIDVRRLLVGSLLAYGALSLAAALAPGLDALIALRVLQGAAGAAPAVFAPGLLRAAFPGDAAVRAIGLFGSVESLVPALAPLVGAVLFVRLGWQASFVATGLLAFGLAGVIGLTRGLSSRAPPAARSGGYATLLRAPAFRRAALGHAFTLGGLLVFVLSAPAVIVGPMGGTLADFIVLQVSGIACFIVAANLSGWLVPRLGAGRLIAVGTWLAAAGCLAILVEALVGGFGPRALVPPSMLFNAGFGLRGPPGFLGAIEAAGGDDARGSALVVVAILGTTAAGTALAAPFVDQGLAGPAAIAMLLLAAALAGLRPAPAPRR